MFLLLTKIQHGSDRVYLNSEYEVKHIVGLLLLFICYKEEVFGMRCSAFSVCGWGVLFSPLVTSDLLNFLIRNATLLRFDFPRCFSF